MTLTVRLLTASPALHVTRLVRQVAFLGVASALTFGLSARAVAQGHRLHQVKKTDRTPAVQRSTPAGHIEKPGATQGLPVRQGAPNLMTAAGVRAKEVADRGMGTPTSKAFPAPLSGSMAMTAQPPALSAGTFAGIGYDNAVPPDGALAAGPSNLVHAVNSTIRFYSKNGTVLYSNTLTGFFGTTDNGDPRAVFNPYVQRFFVVAIAHPLDGHVLIAISNTSDATQGWHVYNLDLRPTSDSYWCDYPQLGFSAVATYISCNMFDSSNSFQYASVSVFDTGQLSIGGGINWEVDYNQQENCYGVFSCSAFTVHPARMYGATSATGGFLTNARGGGSGNDHLEIYNVTNELNCCNGGSTRTVWTQNNIGVGSYDTPPSAPQPGGPATLDTGDTRLLSAFWQNGHLGVTQNLNVSNASGVAFTQINVSSFPSMSTISDFAVGGDGFARYYGSVDANDSETMLMVFSASNTSTYAGAYQLGIPAPSFCTNCTDSSGLLMKAGANTYGQVNSNKNRWGDYFAVSRDPDGTGIWGEAEYVSSKDRWGNIIGFFYESSFPNPIPVLQSISPNTVSAGSSFNLLAFGSDFVPGAVVQLNGVSKPTTFISAGELEASIAGSDIPNDTIYAVNVFNPAPQGGTSNVVNLTVTPAGSPANDNWVNATTFTTPYSTNENTTGATTESTDPTSSCVQILAGNVHSVWFNYTPTVSGILTVSTEGSSYANALSAWTGSPTAGFTQVTCATYINEFDFNSIIQFHVTAGTKYSIMSQCYNGAAVCSGGTLQLAATLAPDNDSWAGRLSVKAPTYHAPAEDTTSATVGSEDPVTNCGAGASNSASVWFSYTPTRSGMVFASTEGSNYATVLSIWTGSPGSFVQQACNFDFYISQTQNSMVPFYAVAGTTYSIMVQSYGSSPGGNLLFTMNTQDLLPSPATVTFTSKQPVGSTSAAKTLTIKNQNSNAININPILISPNFRLSTDFCSGASLTPGATCTVGVVFNPTNPGSLKGSITVSSNANNSPLVIGLSGTAVYPLSFNLASLNFGTVAIGKTSVQKAAKLTNYTSAAIPLGTSSVSTDFIATSNCGTSLAALSSCTFLVTFSPNRPGSTNGVITVAATTSPQPVYLGLNGTGSGTVHTQVSLSGPLTWSNTFAGATAAPKTVTVTNNGPGAITINSYAVYGVFNVTGGTCTTLSGGVLNAGASCTYTVTFTPNAAGGFKGAFTIFDTDSTGKQVVNLAGTGIQSVTFSPASLSFGNVQVNASSSPKSVTIINNMPVGISNFGLTPSGDYVLSSATCPLGGTLAAQSSCSATVSFQPTNQAGSISGSLAVTGSQPGSPQLLPLSGTGN